MAKKEKGREAAKAQRQRIREERGMRDQTPDPQGTRHLGSDAMEKAMKKLEGKIGKRGTKEPRL